MGSQIYVHKDYAYEVIPIELFSKVLKILREQDFPCFVYNCVMVDWAKFIFRFDEAPDFDSADEPKVGKYISVDLKNSKIRVGFSNNLWHHKWLWVRDDYKGFNVAESKARSAWWLARLNEPAKGSPNGWQKQLQNIS